MIELDKRWYNGLARELELDAGSFQISRPCTPLAPVDASLWDRLDASPPEALIFDLPLDEAPRFSFQHEIVVHRLGFAAWSLLRSELGADAYEEWRQYASRIAPRPALNAWPSIFTNWAMLHRPGAAAAGASALARAILARTKLGAVAPAGYEGSYEEFRGKLSAGRRMTFALRLSELPADVPHAWANDLGAAGAGSRSGRGLLADDQADSRMSAIFARSAVSIDVRFERCAQWKSRPGPWFDAAAMRTAFESPASPLWDAGGGYGWNDFFGPHGRMARAVESLVAVDGTNVTVVSDAAFEAEDRAELQRGLTAGAWPFYVPDSRAARNSIAFSDSGSVTIGLEVAPGNPAAIGNCVVGMARYLGLGE